VIALREAFVDAMMGLAPERLLFLDETWAGIAMSPTYGYSKSGEQAVIHRELRGPRVSVIGAMTTIKGLALSFVDGGVDGVAFIDWIREELAPHLEPGMQVVMDNLSVHRMAKVREELAKHGATPLFLPPYSPEFNPIEHIWSMVKGVVKKARPHGLSGTLALFRSAWDALETDVFMRTVKHCGYNVQPA
jgi:transposase